MEQMILPSVVPSWLCDWTGCPHSPVPLPSRCYLVTLALLWGWQLVDAGYETWSQSRPWLPSQLGLEQALSCPRSARKLSYWLRVSCGYRYSGMRSASKETKIGLQISRWDRLFSAMANIWFTMSSSQSLSLTVRMWYLQYACQIWELCAFKIF